MSWLRSGVDARRRQRLHVAFALRRIDDVHRAIAGGEALADEGEQHLVELVVGMEERARVAAAPDLAAGEIDFSRRCVHGLRPIINNPACSACRCES